MLAKLRSRTRGDLETQLFLSDLESVLLQKCDSPRPGTISVAALHALSAPQTERLDGSVYADSVASSTTADHLDGAGTHCHSTSASSTPPSMVGDDEDVAPEQRSVKDQATSLLIRWFACPSVMRHHRSSVTHVYSSPEVWLFKLRFPPQMPHIFIHTYLLIRCTEQAHQPAAHGANAPLLLNSTVRALIENGGGDHLALQIPWCRAHQRRSTAACTASRPQQLACCAPSSCTWCSRKHGAMAR